jgi:hypothetical protein
MVKVDNDSFIDVLPSYPPSLPQPAFSSIRSSQSESYFCGAVMISDAMPESADGSLHSTCCSITNFLRAETVSSASSYNYIWALRVVFLQF